MELRDKDMIGSKFLGDLKVPLDRLSKEKRITINQKLNNVKEGSIDLILEVAY